MQLKISSITNLTDARFFSAMGAHYLGFCLDVLNENNIAIPKAKEIINWLHEPVIVGEFGMHQSQEEIEYIAKELSMSDIQIPFEHPEKRELDFDKFLNIDLNSITDGLRSTDFFVIKITNKLLEQVQHNTTNADDSIVSLRHFIASNRVFIETDFTKEDILPTIQDLHPYGIQISCKPEEKSGLSAVDEYAAILEKLGFS